MIKMFLVFVLIMTINMAVYSEEKIPIVFTNTTSAQFEELQDGDTIDLADLIAPDSISDTMIDFGTGANQVSALDILLEDLGNLYAVDNVETGMQEVMTDVNAAEATILTHADSVNALETKTQSFSGSDTGIKFLDDVYVAFGDTENMKVCFTSGDTGYVDVDGQDLHLQPMGGGDIRLFDIVDYGAAVDGNSLYVIRESTADGTDVYLRLFVNSFSQSTIRSSGILKFSTLSSNSMLFDAGTGRVVLQEFGNGNVEIGQALGDNDNPEFRIHGDVDATGSETQAYVSWKVAQGGYLELTRENAEIVGYAIKIDDFPLSLGALPGDFTLRYDGSVSGDAIIDLAAGGLQIYPSAEGNVTFFEDAINAENREVRIYGDIDLSAGLLKKYAAFTLGPGAVFRVVPEDPSVSSFVIEFLNTTIGAGLAGTDYTLIFDGENNDGMWTWRETLDYFEIADDLVFEGTAGLPFGECHQADAQTFNVTLADSNTWYEVDAGTTNITATELNLVTFPDDHYLLCLTEGKYLVTYSMTAEIDSVAGGDQHIESGIMVNGSIQADKGIGHEQYAATNKQRNLQGHSIVDVPANGQISLAVQNTTSDGKTLTIDHLNITITQLGGT